MTTPPHELARPEIRSPSEGSTEVLSPRAFWAIFSSAWLAYASLTSSTILMEGEGIVSALIGAFAVVTPLAVPAAVIALVRKRLLRPRSSLGRSIAHKVLLGIGYAATVTTLGALMMAVTNVDPMRELSGDPGVVLGAWFMAALFLYTVLLAFLMWLDALERVQETRHVAAREAVLRAQAEAKALRAQFNPHFVFNTLHSLMLLVRKEPERAERAIEDVAALIRYASTLQRREVDQVTLGKELEFAKRYLALEKLRLEERLRVDFEIDQGLEDVLVPAFSLQTLLENSIKHGISPKPEGGAVLIRASVSNGTVAMVVKDDGVGADPSKVAGNGGSGLHLLRQRLETVYDQGASLAWQTADGDGFTVTLQLPVRRSPEPARAHE